MEQDFAPRLSVPVTRVSAQTSGDDGATAEQSMFMNNSSHAMQQVGVGGGVFPFADDAE